MLPSWCTDTVTIIRPSGTTQRGTTVPDWTNARRTLVPGCSLQEDATSEDRDGRTATMLGCTLFLPPGTDIRAGDRVGFGGTTYVVQGEPKVRRSPTGSVSHVQAQLAVWRG